MGWYDRFVLPRVLNFVLSSDRYLPYRKRTVERASGRVLEIGIGSGLNLALYTNRVTEVIGLDPDPTLLAMASNKALTAPTRIVQASAEAIPIADGSIDTVLTTWTLCSIPRMGTALREMRRVLKHNGQLLFLEHGRAADAGVLRWQDRLTPAWKRIAGGCHLNRPIPEMIAAAGFEIVDVETEYIPGPKPLTFTYHGLARPSARSDA